MKATIMVSLIGILGFDENGGIIDKILFKKDTQLIAKKIDSVEAGKAIDEVISLTQRLKEKGYTTFLFESALLAAAVEKRLNVEVGVAKFTLQDRVSLGKLEKLALETGFVEQLEELRELIRGISTDLTRLRVRRAGEKRDLMVAQAILSIDDLDRTTNLFMGRIREWYGLHFPELDRLVDKNETYAKLVLDLGERTNFTREHLQEQGMSASKAAQITEMAERSMGAQLRDIDIEQIQALCRQTLEQCASRQALQEYADSTVEEVAPNVQALVGSLLAARLLALAGGLMNLAKMPASTIQVLGAEKALFRALKTGTRPPKHGVIFQDTLIHEAKRWQRGKMSRALAGKLAIAARTDAFTGRYIGKVLKADLDKRVEEIKERYQKPPPPKATKKTRPMYARRRKKRDRRR